MEVTKYNDSIKLNNKLNIVSIGNYDGVHLGHQYILNELISKSSRGSGKSVVLTLEPHPKKFFAASGAKPFLLSTFDEKVKLINKFPVNHLIYFEFNKRFASITREKFVTDILIKKIKVKEVIVGYNFNFGKDRLGDTGFLKKMGAANNFDVSIIDAKKIGDETISSSYIRKLVSAGNVKKAGRFLGRRYSLSGKVVKGKDLGKRIGFPTVNLSVEDKLIPADGVYSVMITYAGRKLTGVANIGCQPTFGKNVHAIEAHIIDFDEELYGSELTLEFIDKLRDEKKFDSANELAAQIRQDVKTAQASLAGLL